MGNEIRVVIADDHPLLLKGLRQILEEASDLRVVAEASDGDAALAYIEELLPHIAILDLDMPKLDGFAVAREVQKRHLPVHIIFLTMHSEVDLLHRAMDLGAKGYVVKESAMIEIVSGVRSVAAGRPFVSPSLTPALLKRRSRMQAFDRSMPNLADLTPAQQRVLAMIAAGKSTKEIADALSVHYRTVETHRAHICQKLNLSGPNALLRFALQHKSVLLG